MVMYIFVLLSGAFFGLGVQCNFSKPVNKILRGILSIISTILGACLAVTLWFLIN